MEPRLVGLIDNTLIIEQTPNAQEEIVYACYEGRAFSFYKLSSEISNLIAEAQSAGKVVILGEMQITEDQSGPLYAITVGAKTTLIRNRGSHFTILKWHSEYQFNSLMEAILGALKGLRVLELLELRSKVEEELELLS